MNTSDCWINSDEIQKDPGLVYYRVLKKYTCHMCFVLYVRSGLFHWDFGNCDRHIIKVSHQDDFQRQD